MPVTLAALVTAGGLGSPAWAASGDISTVAGIGNINADCEPDISPLGEDCDQFRDGPTTGTGAALLNSPHPGAARTVGTTTYLYFADWANNRVRAIVAPIDGVVDGDANKNESVVTVAGTGAIPSVGATSSLGDGLPATSARLFRPVAVAVDGAGNLFIADQYNHRVRMVTPGLDGVVTGGATAADEVIVTVAGTGTAGYSASEDGGPAALARLNFPTGVAVSGSWNTSSFNLYVADLGNKRVRNVAGSGGTITTVAGSGTWTSTSTTDNRGDGGPATAAQLHTPSGVTLDVDSDGTKKLLVTDQGDSRVRMLNVGGGPVTAYAKSVAAGNITTVAGGGVNAVSLKNPLGSTVDSLNNLYVADANNDRVVKLTSTGAGSIFAGTGTAGYSGDDGLATAAQLDNPRGVVVVGSSLYIGDTDNNRIRRVQL